MISLLCATTVEIVVGVVISVILVGGLGGYLAYKIWAKKHGKCSCGCDCSKCSYCSSCHSIDRKDDKDKNNDLPLA